MLPPLPQGSQENDDVEGVAAATSTSGSRGRDGMPGNR